MPISQNKNAERVDFNKTYAAPLSEAELKVEQEVFGMCIGSNGYTTVEEAEELIEQLSLRPGSWLLEIGSGRGWPGLYVTEKSGCSTVLTDIPVSVVNESKQNTNRRALTNWCGVAAADGTALGFRTETFDAVVHSDVLC